MRQRIDALFLDVCGVLVDCEQDVVAQWPRLEEHAESLRLLYALGYGLHTAGSDRSEVVAERLRAFRVDHLFRYTFGPDLVGVRKDGPAFYSAIARHAGVDLGRAAVVDDSVLALAAAREAGAAMTILVSATAGTSPPHTIVGSLAELVDALS